MLVNKITLRKLKEVKYAEAGNLSVKRADLVVVQTENGVEFAKVLELEKEKEPSKDEKIYKILRLSTDEDKQIFAKNTIFAKKMLPKFEEIIAKYNLVMKLTDIEYTYNRERVYLYYYAENRVDFRELLKEFNTSMKTKVQMVQIGIRDESKIIGGLGQCGRVFCCKDFMKSFNPVVIEMAKDQDVPLNPTKISGVCGRLLCCLSFEHECYLELGKNIPEIGQEVQHKQDGKGVVLAKETLKQEATVRLADGIVKKYPVADLIFTKKEVKKVGKKCKKCDCGKEKEGGNEQSDVQ